MREYLLTLLVTAAVTYMLTPLVRRGAIRGGAIHAARDRDVHVVPIPLLGGLAMYAGLAAGLLAAGQMRPLNDVFTGSGTLSTETGLLLAGGLIVAIGVVDDRWGMSPISKLAGQVAAGAILYASGCELGWLPLPNGGTFSPTSNQAMVLTILVVVATINAVNFIDGLDGLAAGIVGIAAVSFFLYYYSLTLVLHLSAEAQPTLVAAVLAGMCLGFLPHNFFPARIFMGDTGSMLLGLLLAYVPISSITSLDPKTLAGNVDRFPEVLPLLLPAAILVIPYADMLMAVIRRTRAGMSPFAPDRKHLHHRLLDIGHSHRLSVLIMYLWAALFSGLVVWFSTAKTPLFVFGVITLAAVLALLLMSMPRLRWWRRARSRGLAPAAAAPGAAAAGAAPAGAAPAGPAATRAAAGPAVARAAPVAPVGTSPAGGRAAQPHGRSAAQPNGRPAAGHGPEPATARPAGQREAGQDGRPAARSHGRPGAGPDGRPDAGTGDRRPEAQPDGRRAAQPDGRAAEPDGGRAAQPEESLPAAGRPAASHRSGHGGRPRSVVGTVPPAVPYPDRVPLGAPVDQDGQGDPTG